MKDQDKTKEQLINELVELRQRVTKLEAADTERKRAEEALLRAKAEAQRRLQEQIVLREAGAVISSTLDLETVLNRIAEQMGRTVDATSAYICSHDQETMTYTVLAEYISPQACVQECVSDLGATYEEDDPKFPEIMQAGQHFISFIDDPDLPESERAHMREYGAQTVLYIPLRIKGQLVGHTELWESRRRREFTSGEIALCQGIAQQTAIALENARLFEEEKRRATQLALINEVGEKAASILDLDRLMPEVTRSIQERFNYYNVALFLLDEECREVAMQAVAGGFEHMAPGEYRQSIDEGIIGFVARTGKSWLASDISQDPYYVKGFLEEVLTKSELCIPVKLGDKVIGALDVQSIRVNDFDQSDVTAMEAVADRLAIAIENARLFEEARRRLHELESLAQASAAIISTLELHPRLENILNAAMAVVPAAEKGSILLLDEATGELAIQTLVGYSDPRIRSARFLREAGYAAKAVREGCPLLIPDARADPSIRYDGEIEEIRAILSSAVVPLQVKGRIIGVIALDNASHKAAFNEDDLHLLTTFADQAAIAIENARLYEAAQQEIIERKRAEEALAQERILLRTVIDNLPDAIYLKDTATRKVLANRADLENIGKPEAEVLGKTDWDVFPAEVASRFYADDQAVLQSGQAVVNREELLVNVSGQSRWLLTSKLPLRDNEGRIIGIVGIGRDITERERAERLLQALNKAALAMERALTPEEIFTTVAEELKKLGFVCVVLLTDEGQSKLFLKYFSYEAGAIKTAEKLVSLKAEDLPIPVETVDVYRKVVWERKAILVENVEEVVRQLLPGPAKRLAKQIARMLKVSKSIAAPLIVEDKVIGVLSVESDDLTEGDIPAITAFAHQMAAAWRKATLLQDLERSLAEVEQAQEELQHSYAQLRKTFEGTIQVLVSAIEMRDPYTAGHQRRVTQLACAIANEMGLPEDRIEGLRGEEYEGLLVQVEQERRRAEELARTLEQERGTLQVIMESTRAQLAYLDQWFNFIWVNSAYAQGSGHSKQELLGRNHFELFPNPENQAIFERVRDTGQSVEFRAKPFEYADQPERGITYWDWTLVPVKGGNGQVQGLVLSLMDVTERKRYSDELEQLVAERTAELWASEARFRAIFEHTAMGILLADMKGRLLATNPALQEMLGYSSEELEGMGYTELTHPDDVPASVDLFEELAAGERDHYTVDKRCIRKDGRVIWGRLTASLVRGANGQPQYAICMVEDITEQKQAQEALIQSEKLTIAGKLAASLAHEINNPLQSVIGCLGLAEETLAEGGDVSRYLRIAHEELRRAASTVAQLRDLHRRSEPGEKEPTDVNTLLEKVLMLSKKQCEDRRVEVVWKVTDDLPPLLLAPDRMRQVFLNLVLNAVDAMPGGGQLQVTTSRTGQPAGILVTFADSGVGVAPDVLPHIFDPFYSTKPEGLGLGLFISQDIVKQHGGRMEVDSQAGKGTTFAVWLPETARG